MNVCQFVCVGYDYTNSPVGTRRRFNVEAWLKFRRDVVSTLNIDQSSTLLYSRFSYNESTLKEG